MYALEYRNLAFAVPRDMTAISSRITTPSLASGRMTPDANPIYAAQYRNLALAMERADCSDQAQGSARSSRQATPRPTAEAAPAPPTSDNLERGSARVVVEKPATPRPRATAAPAAASERRQPQLFALEEVPARGDQERPATPRPRESAAPAAASDRRQSQLELFSLEELQSAESVPRIPPDSDAAGRRSDQTLVQSRLRRMSLGMSALHPPPSGSERSMVLHRRNGSSSRRGRLRFRPLPTLLEEDETDSNSAMQQSSEQPTPALSRRVTLGATGLHPPPVRTDSERAMMAHGRGGLTSRAGGRASYRPLSSTREDEVNSHRSINETERLALSLAHSMRGLPDSRGSSWRLHPLASIREYETHAYDA